MHVAGQSAAWLGNYSSHRAAKCQEDEHDIHGPHLSSQASKRDTRVSSAAGTVPKQSLPRPATVPHRRRWATAHGLAFQHAPARPRNVLCVPQQLPHGPLIRTVMCYLQPTLRAFHVTGQQPRGGGDRLLTDPGRGAHATFCVYIPPGPPGDSGQDQRGKGRTQSSTVRATSNPGGM